MTAVVNERDELARTRAGLAGRVGVVPTMGALHAGHRQLIQTARASSDSVIVTVFVNPLQFAEGEDLHRYPRTLDADVALCKAEGVDLVFAPDVEQMYPLGEPVVRVSAGPLGEVLDGASRPGHFDGVLTVVAKLFHLTRPDVAFFGEKDAQQLALIRRMVTDLDLPIDVVGVPTVREPDGLAMSSRNAYLSDADRLVAVALSQALVAGRSHGADGAEAVLAAARNVLAAHPALRVDYVSLVDEATWRPADERTAHARLLIAARVGGTRLIDNAPVHLGTPPGFHQPAG